MSAEDIGNTFACAAMLLGDEMEAWRSYALTSTLLRTNYCGYWAYGLSIEDSDGYHVGWLLYEQRNDDERPDDDEDEMVVGMYHRGQPLPAGWHVFAEEAMDAAFVAGVMLRGIQWHKAGNRDANFEDLIVQLALFGELRYN